MAALRTAGVATVVAGGCISFVTYCDGGAVGVADNLGVEDEEKRHQGRLQGLGLSGWKEGVPSAAGGATS